MRDREVLKQWTRGARFVAECSRNGTDVFAKTAAAAAAARKGPWSHKARRRRSQREDTPISRAKQDACVQRSSALDLNNIWVTLSFRIRLCCFEHKFLHPHLDKQRECVQWQPISMRNWRRMGAYSLYFFIMRTINDVCFVTYSCPVPWPHCYRCNIDFLILHICHEWWRCLQNLTVPVRRVALVKKASAHRIAMVMWKHVSSHCAVTEITSRGWG